MKTSRLTGWLALVALGAVVGCNSLDVTNPNAPDAKRALSDPAALEAVVMRCLAKRPADRFQTAEELTAALEPIMILSLGFVVGFIVISMFLPLVRVIEKLSAGGGD